MEQNNMEQGMERYIAATPNDIVHIINTHGIAILENVLNEEECAKMLKGAWDFFEDLLPELKRDDQTTWRAISDLKPLHGMLFQHWGIGHAQYVWDLRYNPKIIEIYQVIWRNIMTTRVTGDEPTKEVNNLKVSFDGASFGIPPEVTNKGWNNKDWFHVDQSFQNKGLQCIQSWVTSEDVEVGDATLSVLRGSNLLHDSIYPDNKQNTKTDWYRFTPTELKEYYPDCERVDVTCKAGSMVFWDSRTVHLGRGPIRKRVTPRLRNVVYLCYMPDFMVPEKILKKRLKAYQELRTTSHWPNKAKLFAKYPRCYPGDEIKQSLKDHIGVSPILPDLSLV